MIRRGLSNITNVFVSRPHEPVFKRKERQTKKRLPPAKTSTRLDAEYTYDIYKHLRDTEHVFMVSVVDEQMPKWFPVVRASVLNWMIEAHVRLRLHTETLFLAINYLDRYLILTKYQFYQPVECNHPSSTTSPGGQNQVDQEEETLDQPTHPEDSSRVSEHREYTAAAQRRLHELAIVSLLTASKFEEVHPPSISAFLSIIFSPEDNNQKITHADICAFEMDFLLALNFQLASPTAHIFLNQLIRKLRESNPIYHHWANYFLHFSLMEEHVVYCIVPSLIAAGCLYLARCQSTYMTPWTPALQMESSYTSEQVRAVAREILQRIDTQSQASFIAVKEMFAHPRYGQVSQLPLPDLR